MVAAGCLLAFNAHALPSRSMIVARPAIDPSSLSSRQIEIVRNFEDHPTALAVTLVELDAEVIDDATFVFGLAAGGAPGITLHRIETSQEFGRLVWVGSAEGSAAVSILVVRGSRITGFIRLPGKAIGIRPLGDRLHLLVDWDLVAIPAEDAPGPFRHAGSVAGLSAVVPADPTEIWVLAAYTEEAKNKAATGTQDIEDVAIASVAAADQALSDSDVQARFVLKGIEAVPNYAENWNSPGADPGCVALENDVSNRVGGLDELPMLRNLYAADVVVTLVGSGNCVGKAMVIGPVEDKAYAVVSQYYADWNFSLAHEIGHMMGGRHMTDTGNTPSPAGHGHCNPGKWYTIMTRSGGCPAPNPTPPDWEARIQHYSNPGVLYPPTPTPGGDPTGTLPLRHVASVFASTASQVAAFRSPAQIAVTPQQITLEEGEDGALSIQVTRDSAPVPFAKVRITSEDSALVTTGTASITSTRANGNAGRMISGIAKGTTVVSILAEGSTAEVKVTVTKVPAGSTLAIVVGGLMMVRYLRRRERRVGTK